MLDLDKARHERITKRAAGAERESAGEGLPIIFGGREIAVLPPELPFDTLRPLRKINDEIALLIGQAMRMQQGGQGIEGAQLVLDLFASNGNLPTILIEVVQEIATALLTEQGLAAFLAEHPSLQDIAALISGILAHYSVSLGESLRSVDSSTSDGPKSEPTSNGSTGSTPEGSSGIPALPASSEFATSSTS